MSGKNIAGCKHSLFAARSALSGAFNPSLRELRTHRLGWPTTGRRSLLHAHEVESGLVSVVAVTPLLNVNVIYALAASVIR